MTDLAHLAVSVPCPVAACRAQPGQDCRSRKRFHTARASAGLSKALNDGARQHERAWRARQRVAQALDANRTPVDADITTMLACVCEDCGLYELLPIFTAAQAAIEATL